MKLLIVDDDPQSLESMSNGLALNGYENDSFLHPKDALAFYSPGKYDVVITDYKMPEMDGIEFIKAIRTKDPKVYVILISGLLDRVETSPDRIYAHFRKPLNIEDFMGTLQKIEEKLPS
jgi:DNA-binding NtrC family response regulator